MLSTQKSPASIMSIKTKLLFNTVIAADNVQFSFAMPLYTYSTSQYTCILHLATSYVSDTLCRPLFVILPSLLYITIPSDAILTTIMNLPLTLCITAATASPSAYHMYKQYRTLIRYAVSTANWSCRRIYRT